MITKRFIGTPLKNKNFIVNYELPFKLTHILYFDIILMIISDIFGEQKDVKVCKKRIVC